MNLPVRGDKISVFEHVSSDFHRKVEETERLFRTGVWVPALGVNAHIASPGCKLLVFGPLEGCATLEGFVIKLLKTQLELEEHAWIVAERSENPLRLLTKSGVADEMEP